MDNEKEKTTQKAKTYRGGIFFKTKIKFYCKNGTQANSAGDGI